MQVCSMEVRLIDANTLHAKIMKDNDNDLSRKENIAQILLRIETAPTIEAIDRNAILRLCNEIECIVHEIYNTGNMMQNCDYDAILNRVKRIGKELIEEQPPIKPESMFADSFSQCDNCPDWVGNKCKSHGHGCEGGLES